jgi:tRNA (Thr-GGU) A37 N-methylase
MLKSISGGKLTVLGLEAIHGTPVLDIKPVLRGISQR